jgi:hypothetical protein
MLIHVLLPVLRSFGLTHVVPIRENDLRDVPIRAIGVWDTVGKMSFRMCKVMGDSDLDRCPWYSGQPVVSEASWTTWILARVQVARYKAF